MDDARTVWVGNLANKVTEEILFELFLQAAPLERVKIPTDKNGKQQNFAFVTLKHEVSVEYVIQLLNGTKLFDRNINVKARNANSGQNQKNQPHRQKSYEQSPQNVQRNVQIESQVFVPRHGLQDISFDELIRMGQNMNASNYYQEEYDYLEYNAQSNNSNRNSTPNRHNQRWNERDSREYRDSSQEYYRDESGGRHNRDYRGSKNRHDRRYDRNRQNRHF